MLVLTRKQNQSIRIGDHITISVVRIKGNTIQIGIDAPRDVSVVRSELLTRDASPAGDGARGNSDGDQPPAQPAIALGLGSRSPIAGDAGSSVGAVGGSTGAITALSIADVTNGWACRS